MSRENSKRARAIQLMKAHSSKSMDDVVGLLVKELGVEQRVARTYYVWIVKNKLAPGKVVASKRGPKNTSVKSPKANVKSLGGNPANLAKIKAVAAKVKAPKPEPEMEVVENDTPEFLRRDELKALGV